MRTVKNEEEYYTNTAYRNKLKDAIKTIESIPVDVFYQALGLAEWPYNPIDIDKMSDDKLAKICDFIEGVDSIYDEYVRGEVRDMLDEEGEISFNEAYKKLMSESVDRKPRSRKKLN